MSAARQGQVEVDPSGPAPLARAVAVSAQVKAKRRNCAVDGVFDLAALILDYSSVFIYFGIRL